MNLIKNSFKFILNAAKLSLAPSLTSAFLLIFGAIAANQYNDFISFISYLWESSFLKKDSGVILSTAKWFISLALAGFLLSMLILIHAYMHQAALEKLQEATKRQETSS